MSERLFSKGDVIVDDSVFDPVPNTIREIKYYQIGKVVFRKEKLLELNSKLAAFVEVYDYLSGDMDLILYNKVQHMLSHGLWKKNFHLEKKKFKKQ